MFSKVMKNIKCKHHKSWRRKVQALESWISLITDSLVSEALINDAIVPITMKLGCTSKF